MKGQDQVQDAMEQIHEYGSQTLRLCAPRRLALEPLITIRKFVMGPLYETAYGLGRKEEGHSYATAAMRMTSGYDPAKHNDSALDSAYSFIRHYARKGPIYTVSSPLHMLLEDTGIKSSVPVKYFAAPSTTCYIEFQPPEDRHASTFLTYAGGRRSICEGCYVQERTFDKLPPVSKSFREALDLDPNLPVRQIFVGFTASPVDSSGGGVFNDQVDYLNFLIQDEEESIDSVIERHINYYAAPDVRGDALADENESLSFVASYKRNALYLAKILFYLNVEKRNQVAVKDASELEKRLDTVAPKKRRKLAQQLARVYDRIIVGPKSYQPIKDRLAMGDLKKGSKRPHYRSGYFGIRHVGTGQAKTATLVRVSEALVNEHLLDSKNTAAPKDYEIR
jgi:hypothetical protein